jgi:hypothetical protein
MTKEQTDRIRANIDRGYSVGGCFIDAIRDDLVAMLEDNELAYHYAQKFQRELLEAQREVLDLKALLRESREYWEDHAKPSLFERAEALLEETK